MESSNISIVLGHFYKEMIGNTIGAALIVKVLLLINFRSLEFLSSSHRIPRKIESDVWKYLRWLRRVFKCEKCLKYGNEGTGDVIQLTYLCLLDYVFEAPYRMPKVASKAFNIRKVWNPVFCHGNKNGLLILWRVESY